MFLAAHGPENDGWGGKVSRAGRAACVTTGHQNPGGEKCKAHDRRAWVKKWREGKQSVRRAARMVCAFLGVAKKSKKMAV